MKLHGGASHYCGSGECRRLEPESLGVAMLSVATSAFWSHDSSSESARPYFPGIFIQRPLAGCEVTGLHL